MGNTVDDHRREWIAREEQAERLIPLIGRLYRRHGVVTSIHGRRLIGLSSIDLIKAHKFARQAGAHAMSLDASAAVLEALAMLQPAPASLDIARLHTAWQESGDTRPLVDFLRDELAAVLTADVPLTEHRDVVLYGFGRIGRLLARQLIAHAGGAAGLRLRAVVVRPGADDDIVKRASLLRRDSVHGSFAGTLSVDTLNNTILANGTLIQLIHANDPAAVDYEQYGIRDAIVVDNTGRWRDREGLEQHLRAKGVSRVLLTAPGRGDVKNIVYGINHDTIAADDRVLSAASCTTNAITPVLAAIDEAYGIRRGHVETVHSYTNDQNLIDNFHNGSRRGRSAVLNMVITETGAAKAVAKALPQLRGRLTGSAIRVPTPDVSLAILNLSLERPADRDELNGYLRAVSLHSKLRQQVDYIESPEVVSTDFVGSNRAGIVDGLATIADGDDVVVYVWYDNEFGYSCQVIRVVEHMAGTHPVVLPERLDVTLQSVAALAGTAH